MKLDQIAFYATAPSIANQIKESLGLASAEWVEDFVEGHVKVIEPKDSPLESEEGWSKAHLQFCYAHGIEIEILTYLDGPSWHDGFEIANPTTGSWLSHIGYHLAEGEDFPPVRWQLVQELITEKHTNEYVVSRGRTFHYKIYDARRELGCYVKYIKRIIGAADDKSTPNPAGV